MDEIPPNKTKRSNLLEKLMGRSVNLPVKGAALFKGCLK